MRYAICLWAACLLGNNFAIGQTLSDRYSKTFDSLNIAANFSAAFQVATDWDMAAKELHGDNSLEKAETLGKLATAKRNLGALDEADSLLHRAIGIVESLPATNTAVHADLLAGLSRVRQNMGKNEEAVPYIRQSLAIRKEIFGETDRRTVASQSALAAALLRVSATEEAEQILKSTILICEQKHATETFEYANVLQNYAKLLSSLGRFNRAWSIFRECLVLRKKMAGDQSFEYWSTLFSYCSSLIAGGNFDDLTPLLEQEKNLNAKLFGEKKSTNYLSSIQLRGAALMAMRLYDEAIVSFEEAKQLVVEMSKKNSPFYSNFCYNIGLAYDAKNQFARADSAYLEALQIERAISGTQSSNYLIYLLGRANMLARWDKTMESAALLEEVTPYFMNNREHIYYYYYLQAKADLALGQNDIKGGIAICDSVLQTVPEKFGPYYDLMSTFFEKKMVALFDHEFPAEGVLVLDDFIRVIEYQFFSKYALLTDEERFNDFKGYTFGIHLLANAAFSHPEIATEGRLLNMQLFAKNMLESTARKILTYIQNEDNPTLMDDYNNWVDVYEQLSDAYQNAPKEGSEESNALKNLEKENAALEKKLSAHGIPMIRKTPNVEWTDIRDALVEGECAIDVLRFQLREDGWFRDTILYAFSIIKPGATHPELVFLENGNELESFVAGQFQREITRKKDLSPILYEKLWAPVAAHLDGVSTLYFSPDGIFHKLNLNTLRKPDGAYLLDQLSIIQVTNLRFITERSAVSSGLEPGFAALFGNPAFTSEMKGTAASDNTASPSLTYRDLTTEAGGDLKLMPLPGSEREVKNIAQKLAGKKWETQVFAGEAASEDTLKRLKSPKVLHIATHGYFFNSEKKTDATGFASNWVGKNPALRSMLFFAGAEDAIAGKQTRRNDGILTAFEAAVLRLDGTELVVLSACNTGLGKIQNGEGVYGLQRAFRIAGAKSLIMSLWEVEDAATALLMTTFYENWTAGMSKTEAFRKAQTALKAKYPQPFYWGSFILVNG